MIFINIILKSYQKHLWIMVSIVSCFAQNALQESQERHVFLKKSMQAQL